MPMISRTPPPAASAQRPQRRPRRLPNPIPTAVSVAALTVYDMCKAVDRAMRLTDLRLVHKSGGKSGEWTLEE